MRFLSVCSGIEAASCAWEPLGWSAVAFSEIDPFPSAVLAYRFPKVRNLGDMTKYQEWEIERPDVLVGGTPCQSFSIAGLRAGLADPRGNLMLTYGAIADRFKPTWLVWENVPGVLSSNGGRDFGAFLRMLGELGYGFAYRVLDAQYFGVAQRRRRVFVVGYLGDWRRAAQVLFESESLCWYPPPSRDQGQGVAGTIASRTSGGDGIGTDFDLSGELQPAGAPVPAQPSRGVPEDGRADQDMVCTGGGMGAEFYESHPNDSRVTGPHKVANTVSARYGTGGGNTPLVTEPLVAGTLQANGKAAGSATQQDAESGLLVAYGGNRTSGPLDVATAVRAKGGTGHGDFESETFVAHTLRGRGYDASEDGTGRVTPLVPFTFESRFARNGRGAPSNVFPALTAQAGETGKGDSAPLVAQPTNGVRRLMPTECEKLQGFKPGWTAIPYRGRPASDGPRYKAIGNSMAVPAMEWIGKRIELVETTYCQAIGETP